MRVTLCLLLSAVCVLADKNGNSNRRTKPFIADAVGNTLPPPSNVPATVGSPISLLTPDRYEFYTFDESGELVKRLMTLEEIQAIVAAGEDSEDMATFANDDQPTIAFNFSQPPYTKVHSVVTNVQNVLKAQMEAHKNKPLVQPTLDTPDVSDSWSLILPSIFGNSGLDIVPDKPASSFTPETETIEESLNVDDGENSLSKEGGTQITSSTFVKENDSEAETTPIEQTKTSIASSTSTTTTTKPTTTRKVTTTKPLTTTTRKKLLTTTRPRITTIKLPPTTKSTTATSTARSTTSSSTSRTTTKPTFTKPTTTTKKLTKTSTTKEYISNNIPTEKPIPEFEKISTFIPVTTVKYVTEKTTRKPVEFTKAPFLYATTTKRSPSTTNKSPQPLSSTEISRLQTTNIPTHSTDKIYVTFAFKDPEMERINLTTLTTQSVSPSTTVSSTEFLLLDNSQPGFTDNSMKDDDSVIPLFDVAQSISQIASDLGNNYQPLPTSSNLLDTSKVNVVDMESKENLDMDIPNDDQSKKKNEDNFVKISTIDPHSQQKVKETDKQSNKKNQIKPTTEINTTTENLEFTTSVSTSSEGTTIDPILTESMEDLLSQVVHEAPQSILNAENNDIIALTTERILETTTNIPSKIFSEISISKDVASTTPEILESEKEEPFKVTTEKETFLNETTEKDSFVNITTEKEAPVNITTEKETTVNITTENETPVNITTENETPVNITTAKETPVNITTEKETSVNITTEKETPVNITTEKEIPVNITTEKETPVNITTEKETTIIITTEKETPVNMTTEKVTPVKITTENPVTVKLTTESILSQEIEKIKIISSTDNKVVAVDKQNEKNYDSKDFVKISVSSNSPNNVSNNKKNEIVQLFEKGDNSKNITVSKKQDEFQDKKDIPTEQNNKTSVLGVTATPPKMEITIQPVKLGNIKNKTASMSQSNVNKFSTGDKSNVNNKKDKIPEFSPKVDEFKKKIQKVNDEELANDRNDPWKLIPTVSPPKGNDISKDKIKPDAPFNPSSEDKNVILEFSKENQGLEVTTKDLGEDVAQFTELCNELAFRYWNTMVENIDKKRSFVLSPYSITSMLAMMFMGARGATSGEMNEILKLDDMVTFNPHFTLKNISDSIESATNSGITVSAFVRELFSDRNKGKILTFYKERAQHFYSGHVEEINFKLISDIIRRRTNLLVKKHTWGKIPEYMKTNSIVMKSPLAAFSTNIFQTDCTGTSVDGRDGEMYFVVSPNVRQRRLVPVPAVVYKSGYLAGYDPVLDATAAALGNTNSIVSTIFLMPGQQGNIVHADDLEKLEQRLLEASPSTPVWSRVLRTLLPRVGLELQIPRFSHKSVFNVSSTLRDMGLKDLFDADHADLGGLNGPSKDLYLSDMIQLTSFATCGEGMVGEQHHIEEYPETLSVARRRTSRWADWDEPRDYQRAFHDPHDVGEAMHLPLHLRPRQARLPTRSAQSARLKFDRPFLFFVRHNPSGMILYVGRYNPRLLP